MPEIISTILALAITIFIVIAGLFTRKKDGTWRDFWNGRLKEKKDDQELFLSAKAKKVFEVFDEKKRSKIKIKIILGTDWAFGLCFAFAYSMIRGLFSVFTIGQPNAIEEPLVAGCLIFLGLSFVVTLLYQFVYLNIKFSSADKILPENEITKEGFIYKVANSMSSWHTSLNRHNVSVKKDSETYYLLIAVEGLDRLLRTKIKFVANNQKNNVLTMPKPPKRGDSVTVVYNNTKPRMCRIPKLENRN